MTTRSVDIAIVGAGAAGLAAAIAAAESAPQAQIAILERSAKVGAKILISGGGRCNVTNAEVDARDFNGSQKVIRNILAGFDAGATVSWFESLGVPLRQEEHGKLFPCANRARHVVDALVQRCGELRVDVLCTRRVDDLRGDDGFTLTGDNELVRARRVIFASGGRSLPRTGSDGSGWKILQRLGHRVTPTFPALVPLVLEGRFFHAALSGVSTLVELDSFVDGKRIDRRRGSLLFTHFGISGPVVLDASRHWVGATSRGPETHAAEIRCNFLPGQSFEDVERRIVEAAATHPRRTILRLLGEDLTERLSDALLQFAGVEPSTPLAQVSRTQRRGLVHALVELPLPVERARGWDYAEVTAGGVPLNEIDYRTMESRRLPGLYLVGELLDCDGRIGGFNFQWAWSTGHLAGRAAARSLGVAG